MISADLHRLAQLRPGSRVRFRKVSVEEAREKLLRKEKTLEAIRLLLEGKMMAYKVKAGEKSFVAFAGKV